LPACAGQSRHHRADWRAGDVGDLLVRQAFELAEHDGLSEFRRQSQKCGLDLLTEFSAQHRALGRGGDGRCPMRGLVELHRLDVSAAPEGGEAPVPHDGQQPGARVAAPEVLRRPDGPKASVLDDVLGVRVVTHQPSREVVGRVQVRQEQGVGRQRQVSLPFRRDARTPEFIPVGAGTRSCVGGGRLECGRVSIPMRLSACVALVWVALLLRIPTVATTSDQGAGAGPDDIVLVIMETALGSIQVAVDAGRAPGTAANFLRYVDAGQYTGGRFHRSVRPGTETNTAVPIQVIQASRAPGTVGFPPIPLEGTSKTRLKHVDGAVSMARSSANTATSDFFICIGDQPELNDGGRRNADGLGFAVFGKVVQGMDVVRRIQAAPVMPGTQVLEPPVPIVSVKRVR
jgi:peptidyl-prolyl cis-trans isomerase A (cyclophilin A)